MIDRAYPTSKKNELSKFTQLTDDTGHNHRYINKIQSIDLTVITICYAKVST